MAIQIDWSSSASGSISTCAQHEDQDADAMLRQLQADAYWVQMTEKVVGTDCTCASPATMRTMGTATTAPEASDTSETPPTPASMAMFRAAWVSAAVASPGVVLAGTTVAGAQTQEIDLAAAGAEVEADPAE